MSRNQAPPLAVMAMSRNHDNVLAAPVPPIIRRRDEVEEEEDMGTHLVLPATAHDSVGGGDDSVWSETNRSYYLGSCLYLFLCRAVDSVVLHICCCLCLKSDVANPDHLEKPQNSPQKVFNFCAKHLSNLWASALVLLIARWVFLRPFDVRPMLGACTVSEFQLHWPPADAIAMVVSSASVSASASGTLPDLRFNLTTHLLFKNTHQYYSIGYTHPAAALFYAGEKLGPVDGEMPAFRQGPLRTSVVDQLVVGRLRNASSAVVQMFAGDKAKGRFHMVMRIRVTLSYRYWPFKADYFTVYDCPLSSPVLNTGNQPVLSTPAYCNTINI